MSQKRRASLPVGIAIPLRYVSRASISHQLYLPDQFHQLSRRWLRAITSDALYLFVYRVRSADVLLNMPNDVVDISLHTRYDDLDLCFHIYPQYKRCREQSQGYLAGIVDYIAEQLSDLVTVVATSNLTL